MGCKQSNESSKKALINIVIEICESWGYENRVQCVTDFVIKPLKEEGYNVKFNFKKMKGGKGEFYIWRIDGSEQRIIFSNKKDIHPNAITFGLNVNMKNSIAIIDALKAQGQ